MLGERMFVSRSKTKSGSERYGELLPTRGSRDGARIAGMPPKWGSGESNVGFRSEGRLGAIPLPRAIAPLEGV